MSDDHQDGAYQDGPYQDGPAPRISVITPHLNGAEALGRCLAALAAQAQDGVSFEAIVVDNGSRELPVDVVAAHPFARLETEATPGPGPARSHGAHLARGEILAFIDADCVARPGWLAGISAYFEADPGAEVIGGNVFIAPRSPGYLEGIEAYESVWGYRMKLYVERDNYTATCNMAVLPQVFARVGDFAGIGIAEDVDWGRRATAMGVRIDYIPEIAIETPARETFAELTRKWDRHIGHDFAELQGIGGRVRWAVRALALAASPLGEIPKLARSDRLQGLGARIRGFGVLARIRLYRARQMLGLLVSGRSAELAGRWRG